MSAGGALRAQTAPVVNPFEQYKTTCPADYRVIGKECWRICPEGYSAAHAGNAECTKVTPRIVNRGFFGGCPTGYVDHPADPKKCVLPIVAAQMLKRVR